MAVPRPDNAHHRLLGTDGAWPRLKRAWLADHRYAAVAVVVGDLSTAGKILLWALVPLLRCCAATYDAATQEFILNTPTLQSMKWWPGGMGMTATHAALYAQLILGGKEIGFHVFLLQLRDEHHNPLPGVEVGEVGPKVCFVAVLVPVVLHWSTPTIATIATSLTSFVVVP